MSPPSAPPLVSVSMPVYNGRQFLDATIESILGQSFTDFELIIVDDASTDGSWDRLLEWARRDSRILPHRNAVNRGHRATSNRGFELARGRYIARTDQDDLSSPQRLEAQVRLMESEPTLGLIGSGYRKLHPDGRLTEHRPRASHGELRWALLFDMVFPHSSLMFRREIVGGAQAYRYAPAAYDYEVCARLAKRAAIGALPEPLVTYRCHPAGMSVKQRTRMEVSAAAISARQIRRLLARRLRRAELESLRRWSRPRTVLPEDTSTVTLFLELIEAFSRQPDIGPVVGGEIKRTWIGRIAREARPALLPSLLRSSLLSMTDDPVAAGCALLMPLPRRLSKRLLRIWTSAP